MQIDKLMKFGGPNEMNLLTLMSRNSYSYANNSNYESLENKQQVEKQVLI